MEGAGEANECTWYETRGYKFDANSQSGLRMHLFGTAFNALKCTQHSSDSRSSAVEILRVALKW